MSRPGRPSEEPPAKSASKRVFIANAAQHFDIETGVLGHHEQLAGVNDPADLVANPVAVDPLRTEFDLLGSALELLVGEHGRALEREIAVQLEP